MPEQLLHQRVPIHSSSFVHDGGVARRDADVDEILPDPDGDIRALVNGEGGPLDAFALVLKDGLPERPGAGHLDEPLRVDEPRALEDHFLTSRVGSQVFANVEDVVQNVLQSRLGGILAAVEVARWPVPPENAIITTKRPPKERPSATRKNNQVEEKTQISEMSIPSIGRGNTRGKKSSLDTE